MKTKNLTLKAYSSLSIALLAQSHTHAQVIIKDFDPDLRMMNWREDGITEDTISIDIDENGIDDLMFVYDYDESYVWYDITHVQAFFDDAVTGFIKKNACLECSEFSFGDTIDGSIVYTGSPLILHSAYIYVFTTSSGLDYDYYTFGAFRTDDYLGIIINLDGEEHYGWVRLSTKTLGDEDISYFNKTGSPITIYEVAYNQTPGEEIICDALSLPELAAVQEPALTDELDANDVTDIRFSFHVPGSEDINFSELRFFLVPNRDDVIAFSVELAISLEASRFLNIPAELISTGENKFELPDTLLDINGDSFSSEKHYSAFYLKIPAEGDTSHLTLSAPFNVIKPELQRCELNINDIYAIDEDNDNYIELSFTADEYDYDISEYAVGLVLVHDLDSWLYYGAHPEYFDMDWVIHIPKTGESVYDTLINAPSKDIYGEEIIPDCTYYPVLIGFGDGYYRDLFCYEVGGGDILLSAEEIYKNAFHIWQNSTKEFNVIISGNNSAKYTLELSNITGGLITVENITSETQSFSFPSLPDGIYIATIKENDAPVLVSKVILQK